MPWMRDLGSVLLIAIAVRMLWQHAPVPQPTAQQQPSQPRPPLPQGFEVTPWAAG